MSHVLSHRRVWLGGVAAVAVTALAVTVGATASRSGTRSGGTLVINSFGGEWGQAIQSGLIKQFEQQTGITVKLLDTWDIAKSKAAVQSGNAPPEDILDTDLPTAADLNRAHLLAPITYSTFDSKNLASIPAFAKRPYAVGWGQFAIGLCYSKSAFPAGSPQPRTWADFWNFSKFPGQRSMLDWTIDPEPEFGLLATGISPSKLYPLNMTLAMKQMAALKPHVPKFPTDPAVLGQMLVDHQVTMEACYTHRAQALIDSGDKDIAISYSQARLETEAFVVWKNAPDRIEAMKFLDFVLHAKPQAAWAQIGDTSPINRAALPLIPAASRGKIASAHPSLFVKNDAWYATIQPGQTKSNLQVVFDDWNKYASG